MFIEEIQNDVPELVTLVHSLLSDLECAESCDSKTDFCENLRSAISKAVIAKQELSKLLKVAEKCSRYKAFDT